ncbi:MAG TPA: nucleoside hydrolase-like domain-containing protein, partial [Puia sp.]|nr:nucleoside hydrolase-like domain-containing protein [Puia sp.]
MAIKLFGTRRVTVHWLMLTAMLSLGTFSHGYAQVASANVCRPSARTTGAALGRGLAPVDENATAFSRLRVIVLTDIEADPDDTQSLIRFLLYSNQWKVEGLIATTSIHQQHRVAPESILKVLAVYRRVQPNLLLHEKGFPTYDEWRLKVKQGLAVYGLQGGGEGKRSEGSDW